MAKWTGLGDNTELFWVVLSQAACGAVSGSGGALAGSGACMEEDLRFGADGGWVAAAPEGGCTANAGRRRLVGAACLWRPPAWHGLRLHRGG
jgi:hypothetical protein